MRLVTMHGNPGLAIAVLGHMYIVSNVDLTANPDFQPINQEREAAVLFQNPFTSNSNPNGITPAALVAILIDHANSRAETDAPINEDAVEHLRQALRALGGDPTTAPVVAEEPAVLGYNRTPDTSGAVPQIPDDAGLEKLKPSEVMDLAKAHGIDPDAFDTFGQLLAAVRAKRDGGVVEPTPHIPADETLAQMDQSALLDMAIAHGLPEDTLVGEDGGRTAIEAFLRVKRDGGEQK
jgi:hypothetical protein